MPSFNLKLPLLILLILISSSILAFTVHSAPLIDCDVLVIGSDPEGISAAISASRTGSNVIMLDTRPHYVGGLYTSGMLSMLDMNYTAPNTYQTVNEGFFKEFYDAVAVDANIDIEKTKQYFTHLLESENVTTVLNISSITPIKNKKNEVIGVTCMKNGKRINISAKVFIDASIDAKFARSAGVPYRIGRAELGTPNKYAAATLVFSVQGVDWEKVNDHVNLDQSIYTGANSKVAWGYPNMLSYSSRSKQFQLRGLNLSLQDDGSVVINALQIFNTDSLDTDNIQKNYKKAIKELPHIVKFLRKHAVGFEEAKLYKYADELYIREGVRIIGEYTLTGEDAFNNVDFSNKIAYGSYPIDLQATEKDASGGCTLAARNIYAIPITIMVPKTVDNLLVVGRSASYDPIVHGSARTVPVGMALGQAAGTLASYSINHSLSVRTCSLDESHIKNIQAQLITAGVPLDTVIIASHPEKSSWAYPYIVALREKAFLSMEYQFKNDLRCKQPATFGTVSRILTLVHSHSDIKLPVVHPSANPKEVLTLDQMVAISNCLMDTHYKTFSDLYNANLIDQTTFMHLNHKVQLLNEDVYAMMYHLIKQSCFSE